MTDTTNTTQDRAGQGHNAVPADVIDRYGDLDAEIKRLMKEKDNLRKMILEKAPRDHLLRGHRHRIFVQEKSGLRVDPDKVRQILGDQVSGVMTKVASTWVLVNPGAGTPRH